MNKNEKVYFAAAAGIVAFAVVRYVNTHREQKRIREMIAAKLAVDLEAIHKAAEVVQERMNEGHYTSFAQAENDFNFQVIVQANEW